MRFLLLSFLLLNACSTQQKLVEPIRTLGSEWMPLEIKGAEQAWIIPAEGSSLLIDSQCHSKNKDLPLVALRDQLLIGMTEQNLLEQNTIPYQNREALVSTFSLKMDGVFRKMQILVLKKESCVFDIVLSTPENAFEKRLADFKKIQSLFTLEPMRK